ncbi:MULTISPECIES: PAS domain S-box protein [unclassified Sphingobium]|jgi:PAS domain S-box-containing protein|uniref:PAS domain S-box protein n=1 Tax=unclassified Sphingobium TaxID=2611147 RepID=UPI00044D386C|nr:MULTISPECIES: PAS domain S-box protein [unclassified Sphingobium]EXS69068.1 hypothetical protein BF95_09360 [Sphingobium sp. Ant17]CAH0355227.1 Blue-light-activated histidine kinase 1 [Sphingobium sp. CECT 9361]
MKERDPSTLPRSKTADATLCDEACRQSDLLRHREAQESNAWLVAIVENSHDAILSKTLDGIVTSWNRGAQRLLGFEATEIIGQPITKIIPDDCLAEEVDIISKLRRGERIDDFETIRRAKNGEIVEVSVTVSPVRDEDGNIIGASKILRDVTDGKRAAQRQLLLLREMNHRVKNLFALTSGLVALSARSAESVEELAATLEGRISSLARAHALTLPDFSENGDHLGSTTLLSLISGVLEPYLDLADVEVHGAEITVSDRPLTSLALLLHEFATNAAKYGALSVIEGRLSVGVSSEGSTVEILWTESGGPAPSPSTEGFGTKLEQVSVQGLNGAIQRNWRTDGLEIRLRFPVTALGCG